ncbi:protein scarlet-like [Planococcus citri]|uniref:protein scarlet-like n=1 Tax=Planococcus citri TaxID=170843 RepID=UPI0031F9FB87
MTLKNKPNVMDTRGVSITWKKLTVKVDIKTQHIFQNSTHTVKEIIHNANGYVKPNSLVGIIGASGSGKSTLMSVLANRQSRNLNVSGDIRLNGQRIPSGLMKKIAGFVYQDDLFVPTLTVAEHLHFAARLKLDRRITTKQCEILVDEILTDVGLAGCANRFISNSNEDEGELNISGGERKRLSVATELLINPALLFCDEPTTGLDSFTALKLMTIMRNMADQKDKTIICSIHQPSAKIFELFHQIILLHDGKVAFSGTTENAVEFFQNIGYPFNEEQNPADYLVKSLSIVPGRELESIEKATKICTQYEKSQYFNYVYEQIELERRETETFSGLEKIEHIFWLHKLYLLTYREVLSGIRDPSTRYMNFIKQMAIAVFIGLCFKKTTVMNQESVQSIKGVILAMVTENIFPAFFIVMGHFPSKMPVFLREYSNNMNSPLIFYTSNMISLIPGLLLDPILFAVIWYVLLELRNSWLTFLVTISVTTLVFNISAMCGILASLVTNSYKGADTLSTTFGVLFYSFSGVAMNLRSIPVIFAWIRYVLWMTYAVESLLIVFFEGVENIQCSEVPDVPCLRTGHEVLSGLGFSSENLQRNIIAMCGIYLIFHLISFTTLKIRLYLKF